ncbi:UNVERIFIED_CONTAM: hypothetical protein FKN15_031217 [Acipenser sinensis]
MDEDFDLGLQCLFEGSFGSWNANPDLCGLWGPVVKEKDLSPGGPRFKSHLSH